jgi:D-arabinose 1-dehydrogenase-like Zn-dependent alcohol dehydrogenase
LKKIQPSTPNPAKYTVRERERKGRAKNIFCCIHDVVNKSSTTIQYNNPVGALKRKGTLSTCGLPYGEPVPSRDTVVLMFSNDQAAESFSQ